MRDEIISHARKIVEAARATKADYIFIVSRDAKILDAVDEIVGRENIVRSIRGSISRELATRDMELLKEDVGGGKRKGVSTLQADVTRVDFAEQTQENKGQTAIMIFAEIRGLRQLTEQASSINKPNKLPGPEGAPAILMLPDIARDPSLTEGQREWLRTLPSDQQRRALYEIMRELDRFG